MKVRENVKYGQGFTANPVVEALQAKAAAKGAKGLLLALPKGSKDYHVGVFYNEKFRLFPVRMGPPRTACARAIYVE